MYITHSAFKIDSGIAKANKLYFAADTKEEMEKWLTVLSAASRGQVIIRKTKTQAMDHVRMRKKSSSITKRAGSVLGKNFTDFYFYLFVKGCPPSSLHIDK